MAEAITLAKFFGGFITKKYWVKLIAFAIGLFILFGIGYTGYKVVTKDTYDQKAEKIINPHYEMKPYLGGCATIREVRQK